MMGTKRKEAPLDRKIPASIGGRSNGIQELDAKNQWMEITEEYGDKECQNNAKLLLTPSDYLLIIY